MGVLKQLEIDYDIDIVDDFLTHFEIMTTSLEPLIISLSRPEIFASNVDEIFRVFHNIKSASGFLHIETLLNFTKLCENVLENVRLLQKEGDTASDELIDWLILASDELERYRIDIENDANYLHIFNPELIHIPKVLFKN